MASSLSSISQFHVHATQNKPILRLGRAQSVIRCCNGKTAKRPKMEKNYYELLGVSADSEPSKIKEAYRKLQKKYHPDIAGQEGHEYTLMLNEAYKVLMRDDLRSKYNDSIGRSRAVFNKSKIAGLGYSSWNGPMRSQGLFVDENACIGCRECVHYASNTFVMDETRGSARVRVQFGDDDQKIEVSVESCPVNCIHWVDKEELSVLEFLIRPQPKDGYGMFGGGWERHKNVFDAAKYFTKQLENDENRHENLSHQEETPAQAEARARASEEIRKEKFSKLWDWSKQAFWF